MSDGSPSSSVVIVCARVAGAVGLACFGLVVLALGVPVFFYPRHGSGNEASAIGALRAISWAQSSYANTCAGGGYATDLADLVKVAPGTSQAFISPDLNRNGVVKSGYIITVSREKSAAVKDVGSPEKTCNGSAGQPVSGYFAAADPVSKQTGTRYFATDARGTIFFSTSGPIGNPIPANATPVQ